MTVLQPLAMYDSEFVNDEAKFFANRIARESDAERTEQIRHAFRIALGRDPSDAEVARSAEFMKSKDSPEDALVGMCRVLYNTSEFLYVD